MGNTNKIAMHQGTTEYPSLHIMVTDNPRFQDGKLCIENIEEAIMKISSWLRKNSEGHSDGK